MKVQTETFNPPKVTGEQQDMSDKKDGHNSHLFFLNRDCQNELGSGSQNQNVHIVSSLDSKWHSAERSSLVTKGGLSNGTSLENVHGFSHGSSTSNPALRHDGVPEISNELSLSEVCIPTTVTAEEDLSYELQQAYRIFNVFLLEKHKGIMTLFLHPIGLEKHTDRVRGHLKKSMCFRRMEKKFVSREYETITEFVADFRLMLENCYRHHGVDHWISKQAQKLEIMLEQKLTLLSRTLREKTTLAVTSKGRLGTVDERGPVGTSTRRRTVPRSLATITVGGNESIIVQALRLEEQQRVKEEKRQRELDKKEAEETSAKEVEEWELSLLSQAAQTPLKTMWELPAIGHFLCLAQAALNLPEIVFFELERCLLMPRCSVFLSKIMSSLLCPPQRRGTLHRRPALTYCCWESELRQRVQGWYYAMGTAEDHGWMAEQLGLSHQFFRTVGVVSPLEENPFHLLPFIQRVWLLKGLCDNIYETQKDVQDAVLGQPIHECRESILGYDGNENAYIHFPHFCGADLRIYCQSVSMPSDFPLPAVWVKRVELDEGLSEDSDKQKDSEHLVSMEEESEEKPSSDRRSGGRVKGDTCRGGTGQFHTRRMEDEEDCKPTNQNRLTGSTGPSSPIKDFVGRGSVKEEPQELEYRPNRLQVKQEEGSDVSSGSCEPRLSVGEHCYTGMSPARPARATDTSRPGVTVPMGLTDIHVKVDRNKLTKGQRRCPKCFSKMGTKSEDNHRCHCATDKKSTMSPSGTGPPRKVNVTENRMDRIRAKKKKRKKARELGELHAAGGQRRPDRSRATGGQRRPDRSRATSGQRRPDRSRATGGQRRPDRSPLCKAKAAKSTVRRAATTVKKKDKRKKRKMGRKLKSRKLASIKKPQLPVQPAFRLVCTSLEELRELISRTEDELDELESTKKRSVSKGRWCFRKEAVKDLHITLIRLLNELSPWEPKLVKAFHRNRLRLKKDYDDFRKHPDYDNFVREEWVAEDVDKSTSFTENTRLTEEEEQQDQAVQRILWAGEDSGQFGTEALRGSFTVVTRQEMLTLNEHRPSTRGLKRLQSDLDENSSLIKRGRINSDELTTSPEAEVENRSREANPAAQQVGETSPVVITTPMAGVQRTHKPVQLYTLLAKSVGDKVTLIHHQPGVISHVGQPGVISHVGQVQSLACASSLQATKLKHSLPQSSQQLPQPTTPTPKNTQMSHTTPIPKTPLQVVYKMPEGMGLVRKAGSPVKIAVQPILDQKTGNKLMQQVVILPSNLLIQKSEGQSHPQQPRTIQVPASKAPTPLSQSSGFTMPQSHDNRIPIQQVAPLKGGTSSPTNSPRLQTTSLTTGYKVVQLPGLKVSRTTQNVIPNRSPSNPTSTAFTDPSKRPDPKQELKTVCIRDSQSILVTTRGGNTGVVKVQTSDQSTSGLLPASPVIISPQFKAFLVSKTSPPAAPTVPVDTSSTVAQAQSGLSPLRSSTVTSSTTARQSSISAGIPMATGQTAGSAVTVAVNQGCNVSSTVAVNSQLPKSIVTVPGNPAGATQTSLVQCVTKPVLKRVCPDERSPFTKFILVSPSSNITSMAATKVTSTAAPSALPGQRLMFISQSPAQASHATDSIPKQVVVSSVSGAQSLTTSIPNEAMKIGLNFGQAISSANFGALNKVQRINLLPGSPIRLPQQASALAQSTLKSTSVSGTQAGLLTTTSSHLITSTAHLPSSTHLTGSQLQGIPSSSVIPNLSKVTGQPRSSIIRGLITSNPQLPVPVTTPLSLVKTSPLTPPAKASQSHHSHCVSGVTTPAQISTPQSPIAARSTQQSTPVRPAGNTNPVTSTTTTTVQQKIVINTPAPLAGGTQILLNNTRFVVPPQGLGPGQHVLVISSPAVPVAAPSPRVASPTTSVPRGPTLPGLATPAQGPRMATQPRTHQPQQAALRLLTLAAPSAEKVGTSLPVSFTVPHQTMAIRAPLSVTSTTVNGSPPVSQRLPAPATILTGLANVMAAPPLTQPEGMGGLSLSSMPTSPSAAQTAGVLQSPTKQLPLNTGLGINYAPLTTQQLMSFVQPVGAVSTRTQVLPTVAVPPIGSTFSRMQSLPVVTVPPLGGAFGSKTSPVATVPPSNSTVIMTPAQPIRTVMSAETIRMPIVLSNPWQQQILGLGKRPFQASQVHASAVQTTSPTTKLLVSPDGAVLNTVRGPTANTGLPEMAKKPLATWIVTPKSTGRVLPLPPVNTDNPWMPTQADRSGPIN
uniref:Bromo domain-containing protein n=1 Tax=Hucho hucho TaxID=62062 RepID=A0A4W5M733_9TELE